MVIAIITRMWRDSLYGSSDLYTPQKSQNTTPLNIIVETGSRLKRIGYRGLPSTGGANFSNPARNFPDADEISPGIRKGQISLIIPLTSITLFVLGSNDEKPLIACFCSQLLLDIISKVRSHTIILLNTLENNRRICVTKHFNNIFAACCFTHEW